MQTDFIIALAWPEGMVSACGSWYDIFFARNKKYRVGHSALALVDSVSGKLRYFDFGSLSVKLNRFRLILMVFNRLDGSSLSSI